MLSRRRADLIQTRGAAPSKMHGLRYMVFDRSKLVAAFVSRDDARHWIEECGHSAMDLLETTAFAQHAGSKGKRQPNAAKASQER